MSMLGAIAVPHPPLIMPEVGHGEERRIQKTIDAYRQMVAEKPLNLHMTSPYLYAMTIGESSFVNTLCGQYAQGGMPLDLFLQKLSSRLNMITLEDSGSAGAG